MKITINYGDGVINIPLAAMNNIELIGENELKLLVYICRVGNGDFNTENAQVTLGLSPSEIDSALAFLRGAGLVKQGKGRIAAKEKAVQAREDTAEDNKEEFVTVKSVREKLKYVTDAPPQYSGRSLIISLPEFHNSKPKVKRERNDVQPPLCIMPSLICL